MLRHLKSNFIKAIYIMHHLNQNVIFRLIGASIIYRKR